MAKKSVPIVALTAFAMKGGDQKAYQAGCEDDMERFPRKDQMDAGCDAYIAKPFDTRTLVHQVEKLRRNPSCSSAADPTENS